MKLKITSLLGALLLIGMFIVGCTKIDEPEGIKDLRGAKAEFLKAQAAVQLAEVKIKEADAAIKTALAKAEEAKTQSIIIENEIRQAKNADEKARLEAQLKVFELKIQAELLDAQKATTEAQKRYEIAMADLKIAQTLEIPNKYKDELGNLISKLENLNSGMVQTKDYILIGQRQLNVLFGNSTRTSEALKNIIRTEENNLKLKENQLVILKQADQADPAQLKLKLEEYNTKLTALYNDRRTIEDNRTTLEIKQRDINSRLQGLSNSLYIKKDYTSPIAIPAVTEITDAVKTLPENLKKYLSANYLTMTFVGDLNQVISDLTTFESWINAKKTAAEGWTTLLSATTNAIKNFKNTQTNLLDNLMETQNSLSICQGNLFSANNSWDVNNSNIIFYEGLRNTINNKLSGIDKFDQYIKAQEEVIRIAQGEVKIANQNLKFYLENDYVSLKENIENRIKAHQNNLALLQAQFDQTTKQKDALIAIINALK